MYFGTIFTNLELSFIPLNWLPAWSQKPFSEVCPNPLGHRLLPDFYSSGQAGNSAWVIWR